MSDKQCTHPKDCTGCSWRGLVPASPQEQVITYGIISPKEKVVWRNTLEKRDPLMWKTIQQMREALKHVPDPGRLNGLVDTMESTYSVVHEDVYSQICDMIDPHVLAGSLPGSVHDSVQLLLELAVTNKLLERK